MRTLTTLFTGLIVICAFAMFKAPAKSQTTEVETLTEAKQIEILYFHNTRRCATCNAIEKVASETIDKHFSEMKTKGTISFRSLNIEEESGKLVGKKHGITEQSLIITNGTKTIDYTNQAFMYARTKPEKLEGLIKAAIQNLNK